MASVDVKASIESSRTVQKAMADLDYRIQCGIVKLQQDIGMCV